MPSQTGSIDLTSQANAAKTATNYITADANGISIHMTNNLTTYQRQSADGTKFYVNGLKRSEVGASGLKVYIGDTAGSETEVGYFGTYARIGNINSSHTTISSDSGIAMYSGSTRMLRIKNSDAYFGSEESMKIGSNGLTLYPSGAGSGPVSTLTCGSATSSYTTVVKTVTVNSGDTISSISVKMGTNISYVKVNDVTLTMNTDYTLMLNPITSLPNDIEGVSIPHHAYSITEIRFVNPITGPATIEFQCETMIPSGYSLMLGPEWYNHTVVDKDGFRVENYNGDPTFNIEMASTGDALVRIGKKDGPHTTISPKANSGVAMYNGSKRALRLASNGLYLGSNDTARFSDHGFTLFSKGVQAQGDIVDFYAGEFSSPQELTNITISIPVEENETLSSYHPNGPLRINHIYVDGVELLPNTDYIRSVVPWTYEYDAEFTSCCDGHYVMDSIGFLNTISGPATVTIEGSTEVPSGYSMRMGPKWYNHIVVDEDGFRVVNYNGDPTFNVKMDNTGTSIVTIGKKNAGHFTQTSNLASFTDSTGKKSMVYISSQEVMPGYQLAELGFHDGRATVSATRLSGNNTSLVIMSGSEVSALDGYDYACIELVDSELISGDPLLDEGSAVYSDPYISIHGKLQLGSVLDPQYGGTGHTSLQATRNAMGLGNTTGALPVANGGTGLSASPSMLTNLESTTAANVLAASPRPGVTGTLGAAHGGTGQTSLQATRNAMGLGNTTGALPVANGGTGKTTAADARAALGAAHNVWTSLGSVSGTTSLTIDLTNYNEVLITCRYSTTYLSSIVLPKAGINASTQWEIYLGGWGNNSTTSNRRAVAKLSRVKFTPVVVTTDQTDRTSSSTWVVYAR